MKAAAFARPGGPEVLQVMEIDTPRAGSGQVRVRVRAAGVQPFDCAVRAGWTPPGVPSGLPRIPGNEFAGVVDQLGEGVTGVEVGADVIGGIRVTPGLRSPARLLELADLYTQGKLRIHIRGSFPLERAADAHRDVETGHGRGKVVLTID